MRLLSFTKLIDWLEMASNIWFSANRFIRFWGGSDSWNDISFVDFVLVGIFVFSIEDKTVHDHFTMPKNPQT